LIVLEVRIRGKPASANGTTFQELRRSGPPGDLERDLGNAIQWDQTLGTLPRELLIVGEEPGEVVAKLQFVKCSAPANPPVPQAKRKPSTPQKPGAPGKPTAPLPRGTLEK
jgi:hypothetical protein